MTVEELEAANREGRSLEIPTARLEAAAREFYGTLPLEGPADFMARTQAEAEAAGHETALKSVLLTDTDGTRYQVAEADVPAIAAAAFGDLAESDWVRARNARLQELAEAEGEEG